MGIRIASQDSYRWFEGGPLSSTLLPSGSWIYIDGLSPSAPKRGSTSLAATPRAAEQEQANYANCTGEFHVFFLSRLEAESFREMRSRILLGRGT